MYSANNALKQVMTFHIFKIFFMFLFTFSSSWSELFNWIILKNQTSGAHSIQTPAGFFSKDLKLFLLDRPHQNTSKSSEKLRLEWMNLFFLLGISLSTFFMPKGDWKALFSFVLNIQQKKFICLVFFFYFLYFLNVKQKKQYFTVVMEQSSIHSIASDPLNISTILFECGILYLHQKIISIPAFLYFV